LTAGRPRVPIEKRRLAGNPSHRNLPAPLEWVDGIVEVPPAPSGLQAPGKRYWASIWVAGKTWLSPGLDFDTVELAARTFDEIARYRRLLAKHGYMVSTPIISPTTGAVLGKRLAVNPVIKPLRSAEAQLLKWLVALAIPPTSRAALGLVQVRAMTGLETMLKQRNAPVVVEMVGDVVEMDEIEDAEIVEMEGEDVGADRSC
jgi:hypothetical protein